MKDLSLYILDITMNSVRAGATLVTIDLTEKNNELTLKITDNGCGMTASQVEALSNPFFTTRKTRKVGLGVPFLRMLAEQTGGGVTVASKPEAEYSDHGTEVTAVFHTNHIDFIPMGDIVETVVTLVQGSPNIDFEFSHKTDKLSASMKTKELREVLGEDIPLNSYEVLGFIKEYLRSQYAQ